MQNLVKNQTSPGNKIGNKIKTGEDEMANEFYKYFADMVLP